MPTVDSEYWAAFNHKSWGCGALSKWAMVHLCAPPFSSLMCQPKCEIEQNCHKRCTSIQRCREHIVVSLPPPFSVSEQKEVEKATHRQPREDVHWSGRGHGGEPTKKHWNIYQSYPFCFRVGFAQSPERDGKKCTKQEEPCQVLVNAERPK